MRRQEAINWIIYEIAKNGAMTQEAMRFYIENRISFKVFKEAIHQGMKKFNSIER